MTNTPAKNQSSKRAPQHNESKELDEEESVPMSSEVDGELDGEFDDDQDDEGDRIPDESVEDQETGRAVRDSGRGRGNLREP